MNCVGALLARQGASIRLFSGALSRIWHLFADGRCEASDFVTTGFAALRAMILFGSAAVLDVSGSAALAILLGVKAARGCGKEIGQ